MKAEGEPEEKKGRIELVEDEDEGDQEGEADEGPEEVQATNIWLMVYETQEDWKEMADSRVSTNINLFFSSCLFPSAAHLEL